MAEPLTKIPGRLVDLAGELAQNKVTGLTGDLAAKAPVASPSFSGTVGVGAVQVASGGLTTVDMNVTPAASIYHKLIPVTNLPVTWNHTLNTAAGNPVYSLGMNWGGGGQENPAYTFFRDGWEYRYDVNMDGSDIWMERHVAAYWDMINAREVRPLSFKVDENNWSAVATFQLSSLVFANEGLAKQIGSISRDNLATHYWRIVDNAQADVFVVTAPASTGNTMVMGAGTKGFTATINGTACAWGWQLAGVPKYTYGVDSANGGQHVLTGPANTLQLMWTAAGVNRNWTNQRINVGAFATLQAQVAILPDAVDTMGLLVKLPATPTAAAIKVIDNASATLFQVDQTGAMLAAAATIGSGTKITKVVSATGVLDYTLIAGGAQAENTVSASGAAVGDAAFVSPPATLESGLIATARVTAADTVTVRLTNTTAGAIDPASATYRVTVLKFT